MRKFLVSYGVGIDYTEFHNITEEIELVCKDSLNNGNLAKFILDYLKSSRKKHWIVLYNFWEIYMND